MGGVSRFLLWTIDETSGFDTAWAKIDDARLTAEGRVAALLPRPHWLTYRFASGDRYVTELMQVEARWDGGSAHLELRRGAGHDGRWSVNGEPRPDLDDALDCDLAGCPLTNTMPIRRHRFHHENGDREFLMAFIEVPSLRVVTSHQRYTHVGRLDSGDAIVRYRSGSFVSDLRVDADGFVVDYPQLGRRVEPTRPRAGVRAAGPGSIRPEGHAREGEPDG